ncbi:hypothetical protein [Fulvivirga sedimenti]|uniref:Bacterial surface antigen (D15) domain-containing protein n=1 Tax=Fulvivirga sedimenti TaxID=2879465 RepID=A0A9X1HVA6_9BACT|nr:hypothetical protein [Fulvivirga sedimenti]MCA6078326.1 hypothetical protein [Fulvivirga sedimenti]
MSRFLILSLCLFCFCLKSAGQEIQWMVRGELDSKITEALPVASDSATLGKKINESLLFLQQRGYLLAQVEDSKKTETGWKIILNPGSKYTWTNLGEGNLPLRIQNRVGFRPGRFNTSAINQNELERLFKRILRESEISGYPFASVRLDSIRLEDTGIYAVIKYEPGQLVVYEDLILPDATFVKWEWMAAYLDIRPGDIYNQRNINNLNERIDALEFVELDGPLTIDYSSGNARVAIPVRKRPSNRIDAIIGFLPNEEGDGGLRITGEAELHLANLFNSGKIFDFHWQRMRPETQFLEIGYQHPNFLRTNLDVFVGFKLLKEDTTFVTRDFNLQVDYRNGRHTISFLSQFRAARLLETGSDVEVLPDVADFNLNDYGAGYRYDRSDAGWLGFKGLHFSAEFTVGNKKIRRNAAFPDDVYDGIDLDLIQLGARAAGRWGFQTGKKSLLFQHARGGWLDSDRLFLNDLYRLGGFRSIRGFNENQFFARQYFLYTIEWQLFFDESSNIFLFADQAVLRSLGDWDNPTGLGIGLTLQTGGGLLQLAYAVGRDQNQPLDLRLSKFHFGYKAKF